MYRLTELPDGQRLIRVVGLMVVRLTYLWNVIMRGCKCIAIGTISIFALGCATTSSNATVDSADADVAVVRGASRGTVLVSPTPVIIREVDGKKVSGASSSVRLSPGNHVLLVTCYESMFSKNTHELTISVDAGRTYDLISRIDPNKISDATPDCEARLMPRETK